MPRRHEFLKRSQCSWAELSPDEHWLQLFLLHEVFAGTIDLLALSGNRLPFIGTGD